MMKLIYVFMALGLSCLQLAKTQEIELVKDDFSDDSQFMDLSKLVLWGGNAEITSAFTIAPKSDNNGLSYQALQLTSEGVGQGGYSSGSSYTSTAVDYTFEPFDRTEDTVILEFDYMSERLNGSGESGRLGIAMIYNYPENGPALNDVFNTTKTHPFGQPTYNLRLLNGTGSTKQAYLFYGGGKDVEGEFEQTGDNIWLPGFISGPGGTSPGSEADYPVGPVKFSNQYVVSDTVWQHYTWILYPERMEVYRRPSGTDQNEDALLMFMEIPVLNSASEAIIKINEAHNSTISQLPTLYNWFGQLEALRFYYRSNQNGYLANISLKQIHPEEVIPSFTADNQRISMKIYPNPANSHVQIKSQNNIEHISFYDMSGRMVKEHFVGSSSVLMDISDFKPGTYILKCIHEAGEYNQLLMIE